MTPSPGTAPPTPVRATSRTLVAAMASIPVLLALQVLAGPTHRSISLLLVIPVMMIALERGRTYGLVAALASSAAVAWWAVAAGVGDGFLFVLIRFVIITFVAYVVGQRSEQLAARARLASAVLDAIPTPASIKASDGRYLHANQALRDYLDMHDEAIRRAPTAVGQPEHVRDRVRRAEDLMTATLMPIEFDLVSEPLDGRTSVHHMIKSPVLGKDGAIEAIVTISYDITERVDHEEREFARAATERGEYDRARRDYDRLVRHRLANPLAIIRAAAETYMSGYGDDKIGREALAKLITDACDRLERLDVSPAPRSVEERGLDGRATPRERSGNAGA